MPTAMQAERNQKIQRKILIPYLRPMLALPKPGLSCVAQTLIPWCELHVDVQGDWELEQRLFKKRLEELGPFSLGSDGFGGSY